MSYYATGTVSVVNGDATVTGDGTEFETYVTAGDWFKISGVEVVYQVASITDDTHLELSANWGGSSINDQSYKIGRDFTDNHSLPEISPGDLDWPAFFTKGIRILDDRVPLKGTDGTLSGTEATASFTDAAGSVWYFKVYATKT